MRRAGRQHRTQIEERVIVKETLRGIGTDRQVRIDQSAIQPAGFPITHDGRKHFERRVIGMARMGYFIGDLHHAHFARAFHDDAARTRLRRLLGIYNRDWLRRTRDLAKVLFDQRQRRLRLEIADDRNGGVVRPIIRVVKLPQFRDRHFLDIRSPANRGMMIRMGNKGGGVDFLVEGRARIVLVPLEFIPHHGHLHLPVLFPQNQIAHPIGLELHREFQMIAREILVIIGAVEPGSGIVDTTDLVHHRVEAAAVVRMEVFRALEHQMLEQMGRTRRPRHFMTRTNPIRDHEGQHRRRVVLEQQHVEIVDGHPVLGDTPKGLDEREPLGRRFRRLNGADDREEGETKQGTEKAFHGEGVGRHHEPDPLMRQVV